MAEPEQTILSAPTRLCGVMGHPIQHSASPAMQNAALGHLGLDWRYLAFDVRPDNLRAALEGAKAMRFVGLNLTVPHKVEGWQQVDMHDEPAKLYGAINTIRFEARRGAQWIPISELPTEEIEEVRAHGFNTDADALARAVLEEFELDLQGASVLLLGAGGAGRVAALKLALLGVKELYLVNRTRSTAEQLARDIKTRFGSVKVHTGYPAHLIDLMINSTSLGLKLSDPLPFDEASFSCKQTSAVYDMIYRPARTKLLQIAEAAGCRTANGIAMLLYQGAKALEIWSGKPAPIEVMRDALEANLYGK